MFFKKEIRTARDGILAANAIATVALIIAFTALLIALGTGEDNG